MLNESNLHGYQNTGIEHIKRHTHSGLFLDMGLGKTVTTLTAIKHLLDDLDITKVLVIAPKRVAESVWTREVANWEHLRQLKISVITGTEKQRKKKLREEAEIYTISRDNVAWLVGHCGGSTLPFDMLVIDESSSFKNHASLRFKALKAAQPSFNRVVLLTGTPVPNGLIDLWPQMYLLDRGQRLGKTITAYREAFFRADKQNGPIVYSYKLIKTGEQEIHERISDIVISMKATDYLDMPEKIENYIELDFPPNLQEAYDEFERENILSMFGEGEEITALSAAALSNKLLQFASGVVYDDVKATKEVHTLKIDALEDMVEAANGAPILVAWQYQSSRDVIMKRLKKYGVRELKTDADITAWNKGEIPVLIMHPASGGHGLNLQASSNQIVWYGDNWSLELTEQLNARLYRQGQKASTVVITHLVCTKTIEGNVARSLRNKRIGQDSLIEAVKARVESYRK